MNKLVTVTVAVPPATPVKDMPPGTYFVPESGSEWPGLWQRAAENTLDHPPATYVSVYLGKVNGASGCHPTYRDGTFKGHVVTKEQALAFLAF